MQYVMELLRQILRVIFKIILFFFYIDYYDRISAEKTMTYDEKLLQHASQKFGRTEVYILSTLGHYTNWPVNQNLFFKTRTLHPIHRKWLQDAINERNFKSINW
jgi:hypothetical protein